MLEKVAKVGTHVWAAELGDDQTLGTDWALIDARKGLQHSASPLVDVLECDVAPQRVDYSLPEEEALFGVGKVLVEHLDGSDVVVELVVELHDFVEVLLEDLQFLGGDSQPGFVDGDADVVDEPTVGSRPVYHEVNEVLGLFGVDRLEYHREEGLVLQLVLYPAVLDDEVEVVEVPIAYHFHADAREADVDDFLPEGPEHSDKADPNLWYFQQILIAVLHLQLIVIDLQFKFFYVIFEAQNQP